MNRFILILSLVFCSFNLLGQTSSTPFGAGTSISPYLICAFIVNPTSMAKIAVTFFIILVGFS